VEAFTTSNGLSINTQDNKVGAFLISIQGIVEQREYMSSELTMMYISPSGDTYSTIAGQDMEAIFTITFIDYQKKRITGTFSFVASKLNNGIPTQETKTFSEGKFYNITIYGFLLQP